MAYVEGFWADGSLATSRPVACGALVVPNDRRGYRGLREVLLARSWVLLGGESRIRCLRGGRHDLCLSNSWLPFYEKVLALEPEQRYGPKVDLNDNPR